MNPPISLGPSPVLTCVGGNYLSTQVLQHPPLCFVVTHYGYTAAGGKLAAREGEPEASAGQLKQ